MVATSDERRRQHVWDELMALSRRFVFGGKQVHDANIVATMQAHGKPGC